MKKTVLNFVLATIIGCACCFPTFSQQLLANHTGLKIIIIRHAEKPLKGDNLTCQGLNRSLLLPALLYSKFGIPAFTYTPSIGTGDSTKHSRMFQTIIPMAVKYNLVINSKYDELDSTGVAADLLKKTGTVLLVWEHKAIPGIVRSLGVHDLFLKWANEDYESIWIITFPGGVPALTKDTEGLTVSPACTF